MPFGLNLNRGLSAPLLTRREDTVGSNIDPEIGRSSSEPPLGFADIDEPSSFNSQLNLMSVRDQPLLQVTHQYLDLVRTCSVKSVTQISAVIHKGYTEYYLLTGIGLMAAGVLLNEAKNTALHGGRIDDLDRALQANLEDTLIALGYVGTSLIGASSLFMQLRRYYYTYWQTMSFDDPIKSSFVGKSSLLDSLHQEPRLRDELLTRVKQANGALHGLGTIPASETLISSVYQASFDSFTQEVLHQLRLASGEGGSSGDTGKIRLLAEDAPHFVFMKNFLKLTMPEAQAYFDLIFLASYISTGSTIKPSIRQMLDSSCKKLKPLVELARKGEGRLRWLLPLRVDELSLNRKSDDLCHWAEKIIGDIFVASDTQKVIV